MRRLRRTASSRSGNSRIRRSRCARTAASAKVQKLRVEPGDSVQGIRLVHHRLRAARARREPTPKTESAAKDSRTRKIGRSEEVHESTESTTPKSRSLRADRPAATPSIQTNASSSSTPRAARLLRRSMFSDRRYARNGLARGPAASARSRRPPEGSRACCRCRGASLRFHTRRSCAAAEACAGRW